MLYIICIFTLILGTEAFAYPSRKDDNEGYFGRENNPYEQDPVVIPSQPPLPRREEIPPSPGPNFVWTSGYWRWDDDAWRWIPGAWVEPPYRGAKWHEGVWEKREDTWVYRRGRWE